MYQIVLLDDEENIVSSLKRLMRKERQWNISTFTDPSAALNYISGQEVDVVISDYQMPTMNGTTFLHQVKLIQEDSMRCILSGHADVASLMEAINSAHIYRYINKPVHDNELLTAIHNAISHRDILKENERLANQLRDQQVTIDKQQMALDKLLDEHPEIAFVERDADGAIIINESDYH